MNSDNSRADKPKSIIDFEVIEPLQLQNLNNQVGEIFDEAIRNQLNLKQFAIKILASCAMRKPVYVLITSILIHKATNLTGTSNHAVIEYFINMVYENNTEEIRKGVRLIIKGLEINELKIEQN